MEETKTQKIARLNDELRKFGKGHGRVVLTVGIHALDIDAKANILATVKADDKFTEDNDPYQEHDFGSLQYNGQKIFWKIDYYADEEMKYGSEDPGDESQCYRVLTIMFASEY